LQVSVYANGSFRRRQFYTKISEWGLGKNMKDNEMRAIVQSLSHRKFDGRDGAIKVRGHQVDPAKIRRWQKRQGRMKDAVQLFPNRPAAGKSSRLSDVFLA
jgi:hypothetical protein